MRASGVIVLSWVLCVATLAAFWVFVVPRLPGSAVDVPSVRGLDIAQARAILGPRGLLLVLDDERDCPDVAATTLCAQRPLPESRLARGAEVHASVARKVTTARVPRLSGLTVDAARALLADSHLRLGAATTIASTALDSGLITASTPVEGATVPFETSIAITVSAESKVVPSLFGKKVSAAKDALAAAGLQLGATHHGENDDRDSGDIIGQSPKANESVPLGSKVDVTVNE